MTLERRAAAARDGALASSHRRPPSPLGDIQPDHWLAEYTSDLLDLLHVLGGLVALEPQQAALLDEILAGRLLDRGTLSSAGALAAPQAGNAG